MKLAQYFAAFAIMALVLTGSAFARDEHSGNFTIQDKVQVGSTQLEPGTYKAEWSGPADNLKVDIIHGSKTVATAEGKIQDLQQKSPYTAVTVKNLPDNAKELHEIQFGNHTEAIVLNGE
jgi:hypothetical protein